MLGIIRNSEIKGAGVNGGALFELAKEGRLIDLLNRAFKIGCYIKLTP
jgi:hypothetical protein